MTAAFNLRVHRDETLQSQMSQSDGAKKSPPLRKIFFTQQFNVLLKINDERFLR